MRPWFALFLVVAGCSDPGEGAPDPVEGDGTGGIMEEPQRILQTLRAVTDVDWNGQTKEGFWVCSDQEGTGQCSAGQQVNPDGQHLVAFPFDANLTSIAVNMTWMADPSQTGLVLAAYANTTAGRVLLGHVRGASPLSLAIGAGDLEDVLPDGLLVFMVWPQGKTPTSPSVFVDGTRQAFDVVGTFTTTDSEWVLERAPVT